MSANSEQLLPPTSDEDFESLCLALFREIWGDPNAQKNGRSGQPQAGVDVFGKHQGRQVGVQCKQTGKAALTVSVLEKEIAKVRGSAKKPGFSPQLDAFILATTASRDAALQKKARELSTADFEVSVWSWDDIAEELLHRRLLLLHSIFPTYWPTLARIGSLAPQRVAPSRLPQAAAHLFGRKTELKLLEDAWQSRDVKVLTLVAWGGVGKTSLVAKWVAELEKRKHDGADYFDWSFYSQGTRDHSSATGEPFVDAALRFFGDVAMAESPRGGWEKGARLAELVGQRRTLLVLDGLEPLQHPVSSQVKGQLKDPALQALLRGLAARNAGLCVVTTRVPPVDLKNWWESSAPIHELARLTGEAGVALLKALGVQGSDRELAKAVEEVQGHALTLNLLGSFLRVAFQGDVRQRDKVDLGEANEEQDGHAFRVMAAYEMFFEAEGEKGKRQLAILRLLGLFDSKASHECLAELRREPAIAGLTEALVGLRDTAWQSSLDRLREAGLVELLEDGVDAHPLIREYFARRLQGLGLDVGAGLALPSGVTTGNNAAWREAHGRLFDFLKENTEHQPATLAGLQPLYQAVYHGCQAGRQQEAYDDVYQARIVRHSQFFSSNRLGAFGADLGAVACFFETPWSRVSPSLTEADQAWLLNQAAFHLRALGRLREAVEPMRAVLNVDIESSRWKEAAASASNLSELEITLGQVAAAVADAEQSVVFADRSGVAVWRMASRTTLADARHQAGEEGAALELFHEAERLQAEDQPEYPLLYSLQGFQYCDLLLAPAERAAGSGRDARAPSGECGEVERRAAQALGIAEKSGLSLLTIALDHLSLGRARLYRALLEGRAASSLAPAQDEIEKAVAGLRAAGDIEFVARGLLTRAWLRFAQGEEDEARADLDEAAEIAERGSMRLHLADLALYRARFFGDRAALAEARRLIEECGYGRRRAELADLEAIPADAL